MTCEMDGISVLRYLVGGFFFLLTCHTYENSRQTGILFSLNPFSFLIPWFKYLDPITQTISLQRPGRLGKQTKRGKYAMNLSM